MSTAAAQASPEIDIAEREIVPEFTGSTREYFRVWIVNLFFTLVTLGVYSAWAKVRKKRYFYGSTRIDGDSFDYFGSPKAILKGRAIALLAFLAYALAGELYPDSRYAFWILLLALLPWLVTRALAFNARNSAFRGLRFDFVGRPAEAARVYLGMLLVVVLTAGLAWPWFVARQKAFVASRHSFGTSGFACELPGREFFFIYLTGGLILLAIAAPVLIASGLLFSVRVLPESLQWVSLVVGTIGSYFGFAVAHGYVQARTANLLWSGTRAPGVRFRSTLSAAKLASLYVGNLAAIVCSAGLLVPWAVVRTLRYRLASFAMILTEPRIHQGSPALPAVGAAGQELNDIFNLDLGL
jgi:uncharacterized membrane protein YjgN (DUF898 family)